MQYKFIIHKAHRKEQKDQIIQKTHRKEQIDQIIQKGSQERAEGSNYSKGSQERAEEIIIYNQNIVGRQINKLCLVYLVVPRINEYHHKHI